MHCFLKVSTIFYKEISEKIRTLELWILENTAYLLKKLRTVHIYSWTVHVATKEKIFSLFYSESEENILHTHCQKYFSPHFNCHHHWEI